MSIHTENPRVVSSFSLLSLKVRKVQVLGILNIMERFLHIFIRGGDCRGYQYVDAMAAFLEFIRGVYPPATKTFMHWFVSYVNIHAVRSGSGLFRSICLPRAPFKRFAHGPRHLTCSSEALSPTVHAVCGIETTSRNFPCLPTEKSQLRSNARPQITDLGS